MPHVSAGAARLATIAVCVFISFAAAPADARPPVEFTTLQHGAIVTNQFQASEGLTVSANNLARPFDLAIIFDTTRTGTADPDLEGPPWSGGNLQSNTNFGNVLILAENNVDTQAPIGLIDSPDDEGTRPAGDLIFQYNRQLTTFGFDVIDVEGVMDENGRISFFRDNLLQTSVNFSQFVTAGAFFDPTISFGDHSINRIKPFTATQLGITSFDKVVVRLGGSGGLDNIVVPEPSASILLLVGAMGATRHRRRAAV
ncbi:MAG: PEP-CTERM sorting domain-containing protein [Anaerolineae bacterium]|nr:PEP-CTERM sorting domain-containing protein [Phycisphaerae bacterium]